jgi:hypothetical protein
MTTRHLLNYVCVNKFKSEFYKHLLTHAHVQGGRISIKSMSYVDGGKQTKKFYGWQLEKDNTKYLLSMYENGREIQLKDILPIMPKNLITVDYKGVVYKNIRSYDSAKFTSEKRMSFREFIDVLSSLQHSNSEHQKLMWFMALTQTMDRANFRVATPAGFGKDSVVDISGNLFGGCATIETPTLAKLEYLTHMKWLAINEVIDLGKEQLRNIEQYWLAAGAFKPEITKHSRATSDGVKEVLDISNHSMTIMYNDIDHYPNSEETYFDFVVKRAVLDRFPPLRLHGTYTENFNEIRTIDVNEFVEQHEQEYRDLIYTFTYYKEHLLDELHHYTVNLRDMPERWKTNLGKLFRTIDLYCESQEEFDKWVAVVYAAMDDYKEMLNYPDYAKKALSTVSNKEQEEIIARLKNLPTYKDKNSYLRKIVSGDVDYHAEQTLDFWAK